MQVMISFSPSTHPHASYNRNSSQNYQISLLTLSGELYACTFGYSSLQSLASLSAAPIHLQRLERLASGSVKFLGKSEYLAE